MSKQILKIATLNAPQGPEIKSKKGNVIEFFYGK